MTEKQNNNELTIVRFEAENVKRLEAVAIEPKAPTVVIGGNNGQGKSSILDAIEMAFAGKNAVPDEPVRRGELSAYVLLDLDRLKVRRVFKPDGKTSVEVRAKDGAKYSSPQQMLNELYETLSFDPLEYARLKPKEQREKLQKLLGLDFGVLDQQRAEHYDNRTHINRNLKEREAQLAGMSFDDDFPESEEELVQVSDLVERLNEAESHNAGVNRLEDSLEDFRAQSRMYESEINRDHEAIDKLKKQIAQHEKNIEVIKGRLSEAEENALELEKEIESFEIMPTSDVLVKISNADEVNSVIRSNAAYRIKESDIDQLKARVKELSENIQSIDDEKARQLREAEFPVDGLSFDESGVYFQGIPFKQASTAEQIKVSIAMSLAMRPELRVILIRDGSLLDDESMQVVEEMAQQHRAQIWIERVGDDGLCTVVIEDGKIKEGATSP